MVALDGPVPPRPEDDGPGRGSGRASGRSVPLDAFAAVFDAMPGAVALVDDHDRYVHVNRAFVRLVAPNGETVVGRTVGTLSGDAPDVTDQWRRALREGHRGEEVYVADLGGEPRWLELNVVPRVRDGLHLLFVRDVTARRRDRAVAELLVALARDVVEANDFPSALVAILRRTCEAAELPVGEVWIPDEGGAAITRASSWTSERFQAFASSGDDRVCGRGEGLPGRTWGRGAAVIEADIASPEAFFRWEEAADAELHWGIGLPILGGDDVVGVIVMLGEAEPTAVSEVVHVLSAVAGQLGTIFERKRAEDLLILQSAIVDDARTAIVGKTLDGTIVSWNRGATALYGYEPHEVLGRNISFLAPEDRKEEIAEILVRLRRGETVDPFETHRVRKNGSVVRVELSVSPVRDTLGRLRGASAIARDVTRERQLEEELRRTQRMESLGRLAGGIAHDFNNLLTVIQGETALLLDRGDALAGRDRESLEDVQRAATRAGSLTRQLLTFAKKQPQEPRPLDVNEIVVSMDRLLHRVLRENIRFEQSLHEGLWPVLIDPTHVEQVLVNLAVNARQAMPDGGRFSIETQNLTLDEDYLLQHAVMSAGDYVLITVTDTGHGMSRELQQKVFDPFFTTRGDDGGTGLGLSTCYGIVQQAGGRIWVYSELGRGTVFKIYLPRAAAAEKTESRPGAEAGSADGWETVLVVEDDPDVRSSTVRGLRRYGYRVLVASNGEEALKVAEAHPGEIHLVVTDVVMPVMGGWELRTELKAIRPATQFLLTSGYAGKGVFRVGAERGEVDVLSKPFVAKELARKVREVLDQE